jgi:hypothetical protein
LPRSDRLDVDDGVLGTDHDTGNLYSGDGVKRQYPEPRPHDWLDSRRTK